MIPPNAPNAPVFYSDIYQFAESQGYEFKKDELGEEYFKCGECWGKGWINEPQGYYDYEKVMCDDCEGNGFISKEKFAENYFLPYQESYPKILEQYNKHVKMLSQIKTLLNEEEIAYVKAFYYYL